MAEPAARLNAALDGRYRIERELGAGGMATVYLAEDLRHDRKVALKVLKPELTAVLGGDRFVQEIKTTASFQHPHILPLFDSGTAEGFLFYVMPYIEGETLRTRLDRETQLGIPEAVRITTEVADALDYAHRRGVIHRDIKPENILLHDGRPMVADFGIALAVRAAAGERMTETGLSLGTPHYMSPEQATAEKDLTHRTDIYSLGCVLFEMLTGHPPHTGASAQQILMKIVTAEPAAVTTLRKTVPQNIAAAVAQALQKLPADRFGSAAEFAAALRNPAFASTPGPAMAARANVRSDSRVALIAALGVVATVSIVLNLRGWLGPPPASPIARYVTALTAGDTRNGEAFAGTVAISPDGNAIVFREPPSGNGQLYLKRREDHAAQPLAGTEGGTGPFFSPDGAWIGFFAGSEMRKIPSAGGASLRLADSVNSFYAGGAWLEDGSIIYKSGADLRRLPAAGGVSGLVVSPLMLQGQITWLPTPLPASRGALFTTCTNSGPSTCSPSRVWVYDAQRDTVRVLFENAVGAWHVATEQVLYLTPAGTLMAVPWDNSTLVATGPPVPVLDGIQAPGFVVSAEGTALYVLGPPLYAVGFAANAEAVWVDRSGRVEPVDPAWRFNTGNPGQGMALSPDGTRLAIRLRTDLGANIWIKQLPSGPLSRLTFHEGEDGAPAWTPDGRAITFISDRPTSSDRPRSNRFSLWEQATDGAGEPMLLWDAISAAQGFRSFDRDWVVIGTATAGEGAGVARDVLALRPGTDSAALPILASPSSEHGPALSPDSRWLAYVSNETGRDEVFIRPFPEVNRGKWQVSRGGGSAPVWAHNGRELLYLDASGMNAVEIGPGPPFTTGPARLLFPTPVGVRGGLWPSTVARFAITPDDQRFLMLRNVAPWDTTAAPTLVMVQNFFEDLNARTGRR